MNTLTESKIQKLLTNLGTAALSSVEEIKQLAITVDKLAVAVAIPENAAVDLQPVLGQVVNVLSAQLSSLNNSTAQLTSVMEHIDELIAKLLHVEEMKKPFTPAVVPESPVAWTFDFVRDENGFTNRIKATAN